MTDHINSAITAPDRLRDSLGSAVDRMFLAAPGILKPFRPVRAITREEFERQLDFYFDNGYVDDPRSFFSFPEKTPASSIIDRKPYHDGEYRLIRYVSGYQPKNPLIRERYLSFKANRHGYIILWTHGEPGRDTVLCHHGYMLGEPRQARKMFRVKNLFALGLDVALFIAPFHWKRNAGSWHQRGMYLQPDDPAMTCESVGQAMYDLYGAFLILRESGAGKIGLIGASLGGYNAALFSGLADLHAFAALMVPAVSFGGPMDPDRTRLPFRVDAPLREKIRRVWELHSPLRFKPKIDREKILVVASRGDLVCPFEGVLDLCGRWDLPGRHFLTGGHWLIFNRRERGVAWYRFLADNGFIEQKS